MNAQATARWRRLLRPEHQSQFTVLTHAMERASLLWAILLSPLIWAYRNKHYVLGFQEREQRLYLFRVPMGFFGLGQATTTEIFSLRDLQNMEYRGHLLTATIKLQRPDGSTIRLSVPRPSKENAKAICEAIRGKA